MNCPVYLWFIRIQIAKFSCKRFKKCSKTFIWKSHIFYHYRNKFSWEKKWKITPFSHLNQTWKKSIVSIRIERKWKNNVFSFDMLLKIFSGSIFQLKILLSKIHHPILNLILIVHIWYLKFRYMQILHATLNMNKIFLWCKKAILLK